MKVVLASLPLALMLMATACGGRDPVAAEAENTAGINEAVASANATAEAATAAANMEEAASNR